ncbi:MAG: hypothetical protein IT175_04340 [Acidobacteria bacterium]|nr:hypothetical protein [Acidobacteriota bacterium]
MIRYLGNEAAMRSLAEWYLRQSGEFEVAGPVPVPLSSWDLGTIERGIADGPAGSWWRARGEAAVWALALENSPRAKALLNAITNHAARVGDEEAVAQALETIRTHPPRLELGESTDIASVVRENAFFVSERDRKYASFRLMARSTDGRKALVEVDVDRGPLAEEWYHVVVEKPKNTWRFLSVSLVAIS